jgi:hypothetical protein
VRLGRCCKPTTLASCPKNKGHEATFSPLLASN